MNITLRHDTTEGWTQEVLKVPKQFVRAAILVVMVLPN